MKTNSLFIALYISLIISGNAFAKQDCHQQAKQDQVITTSIAQQLNAIASFFQFQRSRTGAYFWTIMDLKMGKTLRDPSGLLWGDIAKNIDGFPLRLDYYKAASFCKSMGARLPSKREYINLREYLGAKAGGNGTQYTPHILPNLTNIEYSYCRYNGEKCMHIYGRSFWTSTHSSPNKDGYKGAAEIFLAGNGKFDSQDRGLHETEFRCVKQTKRF